MSITDVLKVPGKRTLNSFPAQVGSSVNVKLLTLYINIAIHTIYVYEDQKLGMMWESSKQSLPFFLAD